MRRTQPAEETPSTDSVRQQPGQFHTSGLGRVWGRGGREFHSMGPGTEPRSSWAEGGTSRRQQRLTSHRSSPDELPSPGSVRRAAPYIRAGQSLGSGRERISQEAGGNQALDLLRLRHSEIFSHRPGSQSQGRGGPAAGNGARWAAVEGRADPLGGPPSRRVLRDSLGHVLARGEGGEAPQTCWEHVIPPDSNLRRLAPRPGAALERRTRLRRVRLAETFP